MRAICPVTNSPSAGVAAKARRSPAAPLAELDAGPARVAERADQHRREDRGVDGVAHRVGHREMQRVAIHREVEGVAADVAGGLEPRGEGELPRLAGVGARQQAMLDLGGQRERNGALSPLEQVGEAMVGDHDVGERVRGECDVGERRLVRRVGEARARARRSPRRGWSRGRTGGPVGRVRSTSTVWPASARPCDVPLNGTRSAVSRPCVRVACSLPAWPSRISARPLKSAIRNDTSDAPMRFRQVFADHVGRSHGRRVLDRGVVHVALRVPQRRLALGLRRRRGVPGPDEDLVLPGRELDRDAPVPPRPAAAIVEQLRLRPARAAVERDVDARDVALAARERVAAHLDRAGRHGLAVDRGEQVGVEGDEAQRDPRARPRRAVLRQQPIGDVLEVALPWRWRAPRSARAT